MKTYTSDIHTCVNAVGHVDPKDPQAWTRDNCPHCGGGQMFVIAQTRDSDKGILSLPIRWLRCVNCLMGVVVNNGTISPGTEPLDSPDVLKGEERTAWSEVRACLSVGATTAAVMMCRKLLFHIAVAHGLAPKNEKDRAPTFEQVLQHLEDEGVVTKLMRPWVDKIKNVGNEANHEIPCTTPEQAMDIALFTRQLLRLAYELPAMVAEHTAENSSEDGDGD